MPVLGSHEVIWLLKLVVWISLIATSVHLELISKYRIIFTYIFLKIFVEASSPLLAPLIGTNSTAYLYLYIGLLTFFLLLAAWILLRVYRLFGSLRLSRDWHFAAVALGIVYLAFHETNDVWVVIKSLNVGYALLAYIGLATTIRMVRSRDIDLGWNLKMVLLALSLPASLYALIFVSYTMKAPVTNETASLWMRCAGLASWIILAVGMTEYSPPRRLGELAAPGADSHGDSKRQTKEIVVQDSVETFNDCVTLGGFPDRNRALPVGRLVLGVDDHAASRSADSRAG